MSHHISIVLYYIGYDGNMMGHNNKGIIIIIIIVPIILPDGNIPRKYAQKHGTFTFTYLH